ncbi:hypothetical protein FA15DRAFT_671373 [Coprinopsis marcescibilis]|uniref:RPA43 OB domain-containing protein n=1 Tax=Coprinopsis marcescibilis TaxID=230819 RepID=A0A5C3KPW2_COPMA|nr:hypothetical protein FA15DRAFT_671373 [Coprinopsis marcescibilis]
MAPNSTSHSRKKRPAEGESTQPTKKLKKIQQNGKGKEKRHDSEFQIVSTTLSLSVPPIFARKPVSGVEEMLDSLIMRYIPSLEGVVVAHSDLEFLSDTAAIKGDCPFMICDVKFNATVWKPRIGMKMKGRIILSSPDHISLLVHRTFNVSIPRHHIPSSVWEFEYGPAENDPEFGPESEEEGEGSAGSEEASTGKWVHHSSRERLGSPNGNVEFTVVGLTVANEMLSLVGSIQEDPFSEAHKIYPTATTSANKNSTAAVELSDVVEDEDSESDEEDTLRLLKRKAVPTTRLEVNNAKVTAKPKKKKRKVGTDS